MPFLRVQGTHRECGRQVGAVASDIIRAAVAFDTRLPAGRSRAEQLALAARYRDATLAATPWLVDEIDGAAEGAGVDPVALFAASIEEIWTVRPSQATAGEVVDGRCSDLVAAPPATADGHTGLGHTNDLSPASEASVMAIEWRVPGEPVVLSLGIGPWISVGWNSAGLSLTGNELSPNDERIGVPRLLMVREQLTARTLDEAVAMALRPDRASSYNTAFGASRRGRGQRRGIGGRCRGDDAVGRGHALPTRTTTRATGCAATRATPRTRSGPRCAWARALELLDGGRARWSRWGRPSPARSRPTGWLAFLADHADVSVDLPPRRLAPGPPSRCSGAWPT